MPYQHGPRTGKITSTRLPIFLDVDGEELAALDDDDDGNLVTTDPIAREIAENSRAGANVGASRLRPKTLVGPAGRRL